MGQKLTDKTVRTLKAPATGSRIIYEDRGFGVRITAGGVTAFVLNYRVRKGEGRGTERRYTIGRYPDLSLAAARNEAERLRGQIALGGDPIGDRNELTVADLCAEFKQDHFGKLRQKTQVDYESIIRNNIVPELGRRRVSEVRSKDVDRLHRKITERAPVLANRTLAVLSKIFTLAIKQDYRKDNPCRGVARNQEAKRERYLKEDELARLTKALAEHPDQQVANIFRLLLLTGARRGEVRSAKWDQFNLSEGVWTKPAASTKQKREHRVPLNAPARQMLASLPKQDEWVFPGRSGHRMSLDRSWKRICKAAGLTGLRIHDLRHSYASTLVSAGFSLPVIGRLLGHTQPQTTHRYAHLLDDPLRKATERAGKILAPSAKPSGEVKTFPARAVEQGRRPQSAGGRDR
jgi:integrase